MSRFKWIQEDREFNSKDGNYVIDFGNTGINEIDFLKYSKSYQKSADLVIEKMIEVGLKGDVHKLDLWFYSGFYLYRHSLELLLKAMLFKFDNSNDNPKFHHDLEKSFDHITSILSLRKDDTVYKWLNNFIEDLTERDKNSDLLRYPFNFENTFFFHEPESYSIKRTHENMKIAYILLVEIYHTGILSPFENLSSNAKMLIEGGNYHSMSVIGATDHKRPFEAHYLSYMEVGLYIRDVLLENRDDSLLMPMLFLLRHSIELHLKYLIYCYSNNVSEIQKKINKNPHSLVKIWNTLLQCVPEESADYIVAKRYIEELHREDLKSDKFRYPIDNSFSVTYFAKSRKFNLESVGSFFEELHNFFSGEDGKLEAYFEYLYDVQNEF